MKRVAISLLALVFAMGMASSAWACDKDAGNCTKGATTASAKGCCGKSAKSGEGAGVVDAGVARVMEMMPKMIYKVGDLETPCCYTAKAKAKDADLPITYVVAGESFTSKAAAMDKLAELMTAELQNVTQVAYVVDGETVHCPIEAAQTAAAKNVEARAVLAGVEFDNTQQAEMVAAQLTEKMKEYRAASAKSGCDKSASGCSKAATASAGGCSKTATKSGCTKGAPDNATAEAATTEGQTAQPAAAKLGCCGKSKDTAPATATANTGENTTQLAEVDETPALANAKRMVREIVEFVAAHRAS